MKSVILESIYFTFNQTWGENLESFLLSVYLILCFVHETYHVEDLILNQLIKLCSVFAIG